MLYTLARMREVANQLGIQLEDHYVLTPEGVAWRRGLGLGREGLGAYQRWVGALSIEEGLSPGRDVILAELRKLGYVRLERSLIRGSDMIKIYNWRARVEHKVDITYSEGLARSKVARFVITAYKPIDLLTGLPVSHLNYHRLSDAFEHPIFPLRAKAVQRGKRSKAPHDEGSGEQEQDEAIPVAS